MNLLSHPESLDIQIPCEDRSLGAKNHVSKQREVTLFRYVNWERSADQVAE